MLPCASSATPPRKGLCSIQSLSIDKAKFILMPEPGVSVAAQVKHSWIQFDYGSIRVAATHLCVWGNYIL